MRKLFGARGTPAGSQAKCIDASNVLAVEQLKRRPVASLGPSDRLRQKQGVVRLCAQAGLRTRLHSGFDTHELNTIRL